MTRRKRDRERRGAAAVELAVCLPVVLLLVLASIEACTLVFVQQSLETTAYETARFAVSPGSDSADALTRGNQVIGDRQLNGAQIVLNPSNMSATNRGELVEVTVTAPFDSNRLFPSFFFGNQVLTADVTMQRE